MKWFLGLVLVVAVVLGALFGVGHFLLPNQLEITRTITIERPRASVFAMINDLRIAREWSPYSARDPDAEYTISQEPGIGQSMRWRSNVREIGDGSMTIVDSIDNETVDSLIEVKNASLNSRLDLRRQEQGTLVEWRVSAVCAEGAINVPCRYMNLIMRSTVEGNLDDGLARLKDRAEQLPEDDFEGLAMTLLPVPAQNVVFVDITVAKPNPTYADRAFAESQGIARLESFFQENQVRRGANVVIRTFSPQTAAGTFRFSVGYTYEGEVGTLVGVRLGQTPGGPALRATVTGPGSEVPNIYGPMRAFLQAHRIAMRPGVEAWEISSPAAQPEGANPGDPVQMTEVYFPIE